MLLAHFLCENNMCSAGGEARRLIYLGKIQINGKIIDDYDYHITDSDFINSIILIKVGNKKMYNLEKNKVRW